MMTWRFGRAMALGLVAASLVWAEQLDTDRAPYGEAAGSERTNLGTEGNRQVATLFQQYQAKPVKTDASSAPACRRVLVTGFGLFYGVQYNIAGAVVESMASDAFWPAKWTPGAAAPQVTALAGHLTEQDHGGRKWVRRLTLDGVEVEVCFLVLDVKWDLAAAITLHEANAFQPDLIIMTGRGGGSADVEWGAVNTALAAPGFDHNGQIAGDNKPVDTWVLENHPANTVLKMTWPGAAIGKAMEPYVNAIDNMPLKVATDVDPSNTYISNNISFAVLNGVSGKETVLAGGLVKLPPLQKAPVAGFLHFPDVDEENTDLTTYSPKLYKWCEALAAGIKAGLQ